MRLHIQHIHDWPTTDIHSYRQVLDDPRTLIHPTLQYKDLKTTHRSTTISHQEHVARFLPSTLMQLLPSTGSYKEP